MKQQKVVPEEMDFVFIHGGHQAGWVWEEVLRALRLRHRTTGRMRALDIPGCGDKQRRDTAPLTLADVTAELVAEIDAAAIRDAVIVAHSMGSVVLAELVAARPDIFHTAVFVACAVPLPGQSISEMMGSTLHGEDPEQVGWPVDPKTVPERELLRAMFCNEMDDEESEVFLAEIEGDQWPPSIGIQRLEWRWSAVAGLKRLYVVAERDNSLPPAWQHRFAQRLDAPTVSIDAGHQLLDSQPGLLADAIWRAATGRL